MPSNGAVLASVSDIFPFADMRPDFDFLESLKDVLHKFDAVLFILEEKNKQLSDQSLFKRRRSEHRNSEYFGSMEYDFSGTF
jgi:hypothetical protein